ncbi:MAG: hypothetical protein V7K14_20475 [Nostoc sp.]
MGNEGDGGDGGDELISNAQCPILLFLGCANGFATSTLRRRLRAGKLSTSQYKCPMPNAQFQIPEKSYTIMSYAGSRG